MAQRKKSALEEVTNSFGNLVGQTFSKLGSAVQPTFQKVSSTIQKDFENYSNSRELQRQQASQRLQQTRQNLLRLGESFSQRATPLLLSFTQPRAKPKVEKPLIRYIAESPITQAVTNPFFNLLKAQSALNPFVPRETRREIMRETPELFTETGEQKLLPTFRETLKTVGATRYPLQVAVGGLLNIPFKGVANVLEGKRFLDQDYQKSIAEGVEFMAVLGPLSEATGLALNPLIRKFSPTDIRSINAYINLAKNAVSDKTRNAFIGLTVKRISQKLGAEFVKGGVGFGAYGVLEPAETPQQRLQNIVTNALFGGAFGAGVSGTILGGQAVTGQVVKPLIQAYQRLTARQKQAGFARIPVEKPVAPSEVLDTIKNAIRSGDEAAAKDLYGNLKQDLKLPPYQILSKQARELKVFKVTTNIGDEYSVEARSASAIPRPSARTFMVRAEEVGEPMALPKISDILNKIGSYHPVRGGGLAGGTNLSQPELTSLGNYLRTLKDLENLKMKGIIYKTWTGEKDLVFGVIKNRRWKGDKEYLVAQIDQKGPTADYLYGKFRLHSTDIKPKDIIEKINLDEQNLLLAGQPIVEAPPLISKENPSREDIENIINTILGEGEEAGQNLYANLGVQFKLPTFTSLKTLAQEQLSQAENQLVNQVKTEVLGGHLAKTPEISQFKSTIQAAVRLWNNNKEKGIIGDIATLTNQLAQNAKYRGLASLDSALQVLRERGIDIQTPEELAEFAGGFAKAEKIKVGKPGLSGIDIQNLGVELANPRSATRRAMRSAFIRRYLDSELAAGKGQLKTVYDETGQPLTLEKGITGKLRRREGALPPRVIAPGQRVVPETGVIPTPILDKLIERQIRRLREIRKRVGIRQKDLVAVSEKVIGKSPFKKKVTLEEGKKIINLLQPDQSDELLSELAKLKQTRLKEKADILAEGASKIQVASSLEEQFNVVSGLAKDLKEITTLTRSSETWPDFPKEIFSEWLAWLAVGVRAGLATQLLGIERPYFAPNVAIKNIVRNFMTKFGNGLATMFKSLSQEEGRAVLWITTGIKGVKFRTKFGREATAKELEYSRYLTEIFDNHRTLVNTIYKMAGQKEIGKIQDYIPFILNEDLASALGILTRADFRRMRLSTNRQFISGLFTDDPMRIIQQFTNASGRYLNVSLYNAFFRDKIALAEEMHPKALAFIREFEKQEIYRQRSNIEKLVGPTGKPGKLAQAFGEKIPLNPELKETLLKSPSLAKDPELRKQIESGELVIPARWAELPPDVLGILIRATYLTKLGWNFLFTLVNFTQPFLGIPMAGVKNFGKAYKDTFLTLTKLRDSGALKKAFTQGDVIQQAEKENLYTQQDIDIVNKLIDNASTVLAANIQITEYVNRTSTFFHAREWLKELFKKGNIRVTQEDIDRTAAQFSLSVHVSARSEFRPLLSKGALGRIAYIFQQFPLEAVSVTQRSIRGILSDRQSKEFLKTLATQGNTSREFIEAIDRLPSESKINLLRFIAVIVPVTAILYTITGSMQVASRYIPFLSSFKLPDLRNPVFETTTAIAQYLIALSNFLTDPDRAEAEIMNALENLKDMRFDIVAWERFAKSVQLYKEGAISERTPSVIDVIRLIAGQRVPPLGKPLYFRDEEHPLLQAGRVGFFGVQTLPESEQRGELYKLGIRAKKVSEEEAKLASQIYAENQRILEEQGPEAAQKYLENLDAQGTLNEKILERVLDLQKAYELQLGGPERSLIQKSPKDRAQFIANRLAEFDTEEERQNYLLRLQEQKILSPDVMRELQTAQPQKGLLQNVTEKILGLFGFGKKIEPIETISAEEQNKEISLLSEITSIGGLAQEIEEKSKRSGEFTDAITLFNKYKDNPDALFLIRNDLGKKNITLDALFYDIKTRLPDDLQLGQIKAETEGLQGDNLLAKLTEMRVLSEGSRKPLLTDTIVNKLVNEGFISEATGDFLKTIVWDDEKKKLIQKQGKGKKGKKLTLKVPKVKATKLKLVTKRAFPPLKPIKFPERRAKFRVPKVKQATFRTPKPIRLQIKPPITSLAGLGRI